MPRPRATAGFTLIEALLATALMGAILAALATITAQWLPNWNRGFARVQRAEHLSLGLERLVADLAAAEFVAAGRELPQPVFDGTELAVTFVRSALGPNARPGLEIVRIAARRVRFWCEPKRRSCRSPRTSATASSISSIRSCSRAARSALRFRTRGRIACGSARGAMRRNCRAPSA